jgi:hypothetical protein
MSVQPDTVTLWKSWCHYILKSERTLLQFRDCHLVWEPVPVAVRSTISLKGRSRNTPPFIKPEGSISRSQELATHPYSWLVESSTHIPTLCVFKYYFNIILPPTPPFKFSNQYFVRVSLLHMRATCLDYLILLYVIMLLNLHTCTKII